MNLDFFLLDPPRTRTTSPPLEAEREIVRLRKAYLFIDKEFDESNVQNVVLNRMGTFLNRKYVALSRRNFSAEKKGTGHASTLRKLSNLQLLHKTSKMANEEVIASLKAEIETLTEKLARSKNDTAIGKEDYNQALKEIEDRDISNQKTEEDLSKALTEIRKLRSEKKNNEKYLEQAKRDHQAQEETITDLKSKLEAKDQEINEQKEIISLAEKKRNLAQQAANNNLEDNKGIRDNLKEAQETIAKLKQEYEALALGTNAKIEDLTSEVAIRSTEVEALRNALHESTELVEKYHLDPRLHLGSNRQSESYEPQNLEDELGNLLDDDDSESQQASETQSQHIDLEGGTSHDGAQHSPQHSPQDRPVTQPPQQDEPVTPHLPQDDRNREAGSSGELHDSGSSHSSDGSVSTHPQPPPSPPPPPPGSPGPVQSPEPVPEPIIQLKKVYVQIPSAYEGPAHDPFRCWFQTEYNIVLLIGLALSTVFAYLRKLLQKSGVIPTTKLQPESRRIVGGGLGDSSNSTPTQVTIGGDDDKAAPTRRPPFWRTLLAFLLHVLVYWVIYAAYRERHLWIAANGDTRGYYNKRLNPFLNYGLLRGTTDIFGILFPYSWRRPCDSWLFDIEQHLFGLPDRTIPG